MIEISGDKVVLKEPSDRDIDELYFWKYEEEGQEARKWNGPYIPQRRITKEDYRRQTLESLAANTLTRSKWACCEVSGKNCVMFDSVTSLFY